MNLGKYQLVISVSVILASAVVALLFDYLKRNNERLREANTELKARRAKELKRLQRATAARAATARPDVSNAVLQTEVRPPEAMAEPASVSPVVGSEATESMLRTMEAA